jgi:1-piperideine-2-carboxylate/1-pyrroline-2-carboxylate reductase [NAD(P)H]
MTSLPYLDAAAVRAALPWDVAVHGLEQALAGDVDPENDGPRLFAPTNRGEFLLMPATTKSSAGVKVLTIAPDNPDRGLEKIQGTYLLFDESTSAPVAVMDGTELTAIRTPAVTFVGLRALAAAAPNGFPETPEVLVFGAGVQALNHLDAAAWSWPGATLQVVGRRPERVASLIEQAAERGLSVTDAGADVETAVRGADVIITVTTSATPLFPGDWVADDALVAAVGQHGLDARELAPELIRRSDALVEGRASMLREAGDLIPARSAEEWQDLVPPNLADAVAGRVERTPGNPAVYCGVGMSWEDLVLATVAVSHEENV